MLFESAGSKEKANIKNQEETFLKPLGDIKKFATKALLDPEIHCNLSETNNLGHLLEDKINYLENIVPHSHWSNNMITNALCDLIDARLIHIDPKFKFLAQFCIRNHVKSRNLAVAILNPNMGQSEHSETIKEVLEKFWSIIYASPDPQIYFRPYKEDFTIENDDKFVAILKKNLCPSTEENARF